MNNIINNFFLTGDIRKCIPEMYLRQVGFIYHLQKTKCEYKNLNKADLRYVYQNELEKECFQRDIN